MAENLNNGTTWSATETQMERSATYTFPTGGRFVDKDIELTVLKANCLRQKTWTYACTANNENNGRLIFANIDIDDTTNFYTPWQVHYILMVQNNVTKANCGYYDVKIGTTGAQVVYYIQNNFYTGYYPVYYHTIYKPNNGYSAEGAMIGVRIQSASNPLEERTYTLYVLDEVNCTMNLRDSIGLYGDLYNSTKWTYAEYNATSQGLQETGDTDTANTSQYYERYITDSVGLIQYTLAMEQPNNKIGTISTGTDKIKNPNGFLIGGEIYYYGSGNVAANTTMSQAWRGLYSNYTSYIDFRQSTNCGTTLTAGKEVYLVGTISNGLFYLDDALYTQTAPTTDDGKIYILIGNAYDAYRITLHQKKHWLHYRNGALRPYGINSFKITDDNNGNITLSTVDDNGFVKTEATINESTGSLEFITVTGGTSERVAEIGDIIDNIADYVVEQGVSNSLTYRKWNSGLAEAWGTFILPATYTWKAWGDCYETSTGVTVTYPNVFLEKPWINASSTYSSGASSTMSTEIFRYYDNDVQIFATRPNTATVGEISFFVELKGRWK